METVSGYADSPEIGGLYRVAIYKHAAPTGLEVLISDIASIKHGVPTGLGRRFDGIGPCKHFVPTGLRGFNLSLVTSAAPTIAP